MGRLDELHPRGITLLYLTVIGGLQAIGQIVSNSSTVEVKNVGGKMYNMGGTNTGSKTC